MKPHEDGRVKSFPNIFKRFCFFDSGPDCPPTESVRDGTMTLAYPPSHVRKSEGLAQAQRTPRTPLVFLAFPAPWRDTIFPALNDPHLLSESELIVWKARTHFLQEIFCSASNRVARRGDTKAQFANQTGSRGVEQFDSPDLHLSGSRTRSVAPAYRLFDPGYCRSLDLSMTYKFCDRN